MVKAAFLLVVAASSAVVGAASAVEETGALRCLNGAEMRRALSEGEALSPARAVKVARDKFPGEPISVQLCRDGASHIYKIAILRKDGRVARVTLEAVSGKISFNP